MNSDEPTPNADLQALNRLVGTWQLSGDTTGITTYEWLEGGFFLIQRFDTTAHGQRSQGIEIIGHWQQLGEAADSAIRSQLFDSTGNTLACIYEMEGDTLTIWYKEKGSEGYFRGQFNEDGTVNTGEWVWPGGGYTSIMTKQTDCP